MTYFGSGDRDYIQKDFTLKEMKDFTIRKEILWESETASPQELKQKEDEFIVSLGEMILIKGNNLHPKFEKEQ